MAKVNNNKSYQWLKLIITKVTNTSQKNNRLFKMFIRDN